MLIIKKAKEASLEWGAKTFAKFVRLAGMKHASVISARFAEKLIPTVTTKTPHGPLTFYCPGKLPEMQARTILHKEPETIEWLNSIDSNEVLWDIGANVGVYSLYAALRGNKVWAFEPSPGNYFLLNKNIELNQLDKKISALCIAFSNVSKRDSFYMENTEVGSAMNSFGEAVDSKGQAMKSSYRQAMMGFQVDDFLEKYPDVDFPNHIKIDVDGLEDRILKGATKTLADSRLKSISVEFDTKNEAFIKDITAIIEKGGLKFFRKAQSPDAKKSIHPDVYNFVFKR